MVSVEPRLLGLLLASYEGEQLDGRCHGVGTGVFTSGVVYRGDWEHGVMHGKGTLTWPDGVTYEGDVRHNKLTGTAKYTWPDGSRYEGEVRDGLRHGRGVFVAPTKERYEGEWKDGLREGQGILWYNEQHTVHYKGEWHRGQRHGHGVIVYPSGATYDGMWANNRKNGLGVMVWPATNERYQGEWLDDYQHGFGEHIWVESRPERATAGIEKQMCNIYRGHWSRGERCGDGAFFYADGSQYSGQWRNNQKHGYGVHVFADGRMYEGEFREDKIVHTYNITTKSGEIPPFFKLHVQDVVQAEGPGPDSCQREVVAIEKLLLRYQTELKLLYKEYTLQSQRSKYIFSMQMQQFWRFLYECSIMPQITATEVGLCLRDMHKQQAHLVWVNHVVAAATPQREEASPEPAAEQDDAAAAAAAEEGVEERMEEGAQPVELETHGDDVVFDDDNGSETTEPACNGEVVEGAPKRSGARLRDVYEVHQGGPETPSSFAAYVDPARPILLREFAELLVRVCARYTQRFFEGPGGLYACVSVLFEHKVKPLAQRTSKLDDFTRTLFSAELQALIKGAELALHQVFEQLRESSSAAPTAPECEAVSLARILSWVTTNGWISSSVPLPALLQCMHRGKASSVGKSASTVDLTILFTPCVFFEFAEILCRLLDSEHWNFPQPRGTTVAPSAAAATEDENPESAVPEPQENGQGEEAAIGREQQPQSGEDDERGRPTEGSLDAAAEAVVQKTLPEKLQIFLEQQLPNAATQS